MSSRNLDRAVSNIVKRCLPIAVATYAGETTILVIMESSITSRARRNAEVRDAMGKPGRDFDLLVYTPTEVRELRGEPECPLGDVLAVCKVVYGSLDSLR